MNPEGLLKRSPLSTYLILLFTIAAQKREINYKLIQMRKKERFFSLIPHYPQISLSNKSAQKGEAGSPRDWRTARTAMSLADLGVCVLGGENVGRRSLIERFTGGVFGPSHDDVSEWSSTFRDRDGWTHSLLVMRPPNCTCVRDHWQVGSVAWFHFFLLW